jgi:hypothetical protein
MGNEYLIANLQQRVLRLEAAIKQLDNNDVTAIKRLGGLEDRIEKLEGRAKEGDSAEFGQCLFAHWDGVSDLATPSNGRDLEAEMLYRRQLRVGWIIQFLETNPGIDAEEAKKILLPST